MSYLFHEFLYRPLFNALVFLYDRVTFGDLGIAIIILTILIRFVLYPLFRKSMRNQMLLQRIQPEVKRIQEHHRDNREKQAQALLALYREHKVNPFSGFLLLLVQLPILLALYRVFLNGFSPDSFSDLYSFISHPEAINASFIGLLDLTKPSIVVLGIAAVAQYFQAKSSIPKREEGKEPTPADRIGRQMVFLGPILTIVFLFKLPAAIGIYWAATSIFSVVQQVFINRSITRDLGNKYGAVQTKGNEIS
ncbi:MAG: YidC/Oxa1 family membrane protein insertase [Patescibacteria group bacterium]